MRRDARSVLYDRRLHNYRPIHLCTISEDPNNSFHPTASWVMLFDLIYTPITLHAKCDLFSCSVLYL